jgi:ubiquinone/menaquinone biosynthesis C-methylase UbiE
MNAVWKVLERSGPYNLVQKLARMGGPDELEALFKDWIDGEERESALELGCGTGIWTLTRCRDYVRTDINDDYFPKPDPEGMTFRKADAANLSEFADGRFQLVYCVGLYHHLPEEAVLASVSEAERVLAPGGAVIILDAILPTSPWNLVAWILRKMDRGRWIRTHEAMTALMKRTGMRLVRTQLCRWGPGLEGAGYHLVPTGSAENPS